MRRVSRGAVFWGSALITAGLVILAIQQGLIDAALLSNLGQWWPLLLIGAGLAIIFAGVLGVVAVALSGILLGLLVGGLVSGSANLGVGCANEPEGQLTSYEEGSFSADAPVIAFQLNCVTLDIAGGDGDGWTVDADEAGAEGLELTALDGRLELRNEDTGNIGMVDRGRLVVGVPRDVEASIDLSLNAGEVHLDLSDGLWGELDLTGNAMAMQVDLSDADATDVSISMNAGSANIQLSEDVFFGSPMRLSANAGSFDLCAPEELGLAITMDTNVTVGHNLAEQGLIEDGDTWQTDGFDSASRHRVEIIFSGNAASFSLNPEDGCS
jgi:Domain of unknown function (DUF5668)